MQSLKLNPESLREAVEPSSTFWAHIYANQLSANESSIRQYDKQRSVKVFAMGAKVSIAVTALDRALTDNKRVCLARLSRTLAILIVFRPSMES